MESKQTKESTREISQEKLFSLVHALIGGYPNPNDPQPPEPRDPFIRIALENLERL